MDISKAGDTELFDYCRKNLTSALVGDIMDQMDYIHQFLPQKIQSLRNDMICVGRAMTVQEADCTGSFLSHEKKEKPFGVMLEALDDLKENEVYICTGSSLNYAQWGGLMTNRAKILKANGAVVNSFSRDTNEILELDFPVFSSGNYAQDQGCRGRVIDYRCPITFDNGVVVKPGDIVFGDIDGVVIIPQSIETEVIQKAYDKLNGEDVVRKEILAGVSTTEVFRKYNIM